MPLRLAAPLTWCAGILTCSVLLAASQPPSQSPPQAAELRSVPDLSIRAACIEVAWLSDPVTYPLHLRADQEPGQSMITLSGYVPNDLLRQKALAVARYACPDVVITNGLSVQPNMAIPQTAVPDQTLLARLAQVVEQAVPGLGKQVQLAIDSDGVTTVSGRVDEFPTRRKLIRALQGVPGCTAIRYELRVGASAAAVSDNTGKPGLRPASAVAGKTASASSKVDSQVRQASHAASGGAASSPQSPTLVKGGKGVVSGGQPNSQPPASNAPAQLLFPSLSGLTPPAPPILLGTPTPPQSDTEKNTGTAVEKTPPAPTAPDAGPGALPMIAPVEPPKPPSADSSKPKK
jgi:hypothetical protein